MKINDLKLFKRLFHYMKPFWGRYLVALVLMIMVVGLDLVSPYLVGLSLKYLGEEIIDFSKIINLFIVSLIAILLGAAINYIQSMILYKTAHRIVFKIREDVFSHIQSLSHNQFNNIPVGKLVTRATSDVNVLFELYSNVIINVLKNIFTIIGVFIAMMLLNVSLTLIVLTIFPIVIIVTILFRKKLRVIHREVRACVSNMNAFLSENITGIKTIQTFNQEKKKYNEFKENNFELRKNSLREIFTFGVFRPLIYLIYIVSVVLVLYYGGNKAIDFQLGVISVAVTFNLLFTFYQYISKFYNPVQALADQYNALQSAFASAERIFEVLDTVPEVMDSEDAIDIDLKGNIEFKNVWFKYVEDEWVLKDVSFTINAKDVVAFVGATGSGKTTILSLITRNYDIQKGQILIDGIDIKKIKISSLRSQIGQMLQDVFLFSGTIKSNINLDDETITNCDIIKASDEVCLTPIIERNENGFDEVVNERGNNLSLGERQLISFARTVAHKPKLIILDEATSNIDTQTETIIKESLERIINNNTMIMVAHRLSTIQHANKIFVFHNGRIIEEGDHQSLLKKKGRYYKLYMMQFEKSN